MTHEELLRDLAADLRVPAAAKGTCRWVTMHASLGSQWLERGCPQADVLTVRGSHTKQEVAIYEVKANRADWTKEMRSGKWEHYLPFCHRLFFAAPSGLVERSEVPEGCGLITRSGKGWHVAMAAKRREDSVWEEPAYSLMCGLLFSIGNQETSLQAEQRRVSSMYHDVTWHEDYKRLRRELGEEIARLLVVAREVDREHKLLERIDTIESNLRHAANALGVRPVDAGVHGALPTWHDWGFGDRLKKASMAAEALERASGLLATNGTCPPVGEWPVEVDREAHLLGELDCHRCKVADHFRRQRCWATWLRSLDAVTWCKYMQAVELI